MKLFDEAYRGRRVLITGHTGFKGSWLALWLHELGAEITGIGLTPATTPNHWDLLQLPIQDHRVDIRDRQAVRSVIQKSQPEIVFHLAAQPLVRRSYRDPLESWSTNVMGTAHVLEACREQDSVRAIVAITTDKCYENREWTWGYREIDLLGGHDPYSASKAGSELVAASYRSAFFASRGAPQLATARAGNVIGGGDWSEDRLIPDLIRALEADQSLEIRSPAATRPWQHVLESLSGYLMLGQRLLSGDSRFAEAWNFGPEPEGNRPVAEVLERLAHHWSQMRWHITQEPQPHEAALLYLDSAKARSRLNWQPVWNLEATLAQTAHWYRTWMESQEVTSRQQLLDYVDSAANAGHEWTGQ
ncbi:CDP-glucose 4,6-dehydratase [Billgrantia montanilacus]|nr:CDP-glucose 4,6-dehydratase [Halomonas montanilacus]